MDTIFIRQLTIETVIGIYDWEREIKQAVLFDLEMACDVARAAASDSVDDTLNYKAVCKRVIAFVEGSEFQLVETLAERVAQLIISEFEVPWLRLQVNKRGALRGAIDVGVMIERGERHDGAGATMPSAASRGLT
ncbi:MAG: dihydroneopterin aldolase [Gammaproteobacteria bacterium]|jgi:dihydroneopterin aldolase